MRLWGRIKRFFRSRQLLVVLDGREWLAKLPDRAVIHQTQVRGHIIFLSIDMSDVSRANPVEFVHVPPQGAPVPPVKTLKPGGMPQA